MSVIAFNGFGAADNNAIAGLFDSVDLTFGGPGISLGRFGDYGMNLSNSGFGYEMYYYDLVPGPGPWIQNCNIKYSDATTIGVGGAVFALMDGGSMQVSVGFDLAGHVIIWRGGSIGAPVSGTVLATSALPWITDTNWHHLEWKASIDNTTGTVVVKIDRQIAVTFTGDTQATGAARATKAAIHFADLTGVFRNHSGYAVMDTAGSQFNDFMGPLRVDIHVPILNGSTNQFTPNASTNVSQVQDWANKSVLTNSPVPDDGSTFVSSGPFVANKDDLYIVDGFSTFKGPYALQTTIRANTDVNAGPRVLKSLLKINGTTYVGTTAFAVDSTVWKFYKDRSWLEINPDTSAVYTASDFSGFEFGFRNVGNLGSTETVFVSQLRVERLSSALDPFVPNHPLWIRG